MALIDKTSLYDRHNRDQLGNSVGGPNGTGPLPSDGDFFHDEGNTTSPFSSTMGLKEDQMVDLLTKNVTSNNHGYIGQGSITYTPSPNTSPYQDMNGSTTEYGEGFVNPLTGNYDGRYTHPETGGNF